MYSDGPPHMAKQKQDDQHEHTFSSYVRIRDVALKTCQRRWTIGNSGERGSVISVLVAWHDDDDDIWLSSSTCNHVILYLNPLLNATILLFCVWLQSSTQQFCYSSFNCFCSCSSSVIPHFITGILLFYNELQLFCCSAIGCFHSRTFSNSVFAYYVLLFLCNCFQIYIKSLSYISFLFTSYSTILLFLRVPFYYSAFDFSHSHNILLSCILLVSFMQFSLILYFILL